MVGWGALVQGPILEVPGTLPTTDFLLRAHLIRHKQHVYHPSLSSGLGLCPSSSRVDNQFLLILAGFTEDWCLVWQQFWPELNPGYKHLLSVRFLVDFRRISCPRVSKSIPYLMLPSDYFVN